MLWFHIFPGWWAQSFRMRPLWEAEVSIAVPDLMILFLPPLGLGGLGDSRFPAHPTCRGYSQHGDSGERCGLLLATLQLLWPGALHGFCWLHLLPGRPGCWVLWGQPPGLPAPGSCLCPWPPCLLPWGLLPQPGGSWNGECDWGPRARECGDGRGRALSWGACALFSLLTPWGPLSHRPSLPPLPAGSTLNLWCLRQELLSSADPNLLGSCHRKERNCQRGFWSHGYTFPRRLLF